MVTALVLWKLRDWWKDGIVERLRWLLSDLRADHTHDWNSNTDEWLPAPRRNLGSTGRLSNRKAGAR